jgi:hypothetical protein
MLCILVGLWSRGRPSRGSVLLVWSCWSVGLWLYVGVCGDEVGFWG